MTRPFKNRKISNPFEVTYFKPRGIPLKVLDEVCLGVDEMEAIRLADKEGMYQADSAEKMGVSRQTFGNIIKSAHAKLAEALIEGKAIRIEGGPVLFEGKGVEEADGEVAGRGRRRRRRGQQP
jgi:predicted DNA-binding protein (UPF0251 family)